MRETEDILQQFAQLAPQAGLDPEGWRPELLSRRDDAVMHRVVVGLDAPGRAPLVLKRVFRPVDPDKFAEQATAQQAAAAIVPGAPRVLTWDADVQLIVMERLPGRTLFDLCAGSEDHAAHLVAAGRWVDQLHRARGIEERQFQPKYTLRHLDRMVQDVASRTRDVPKRPRFLELADRLRDLAPPPEDCHTIAAMAHGDLNLRNILVDGDMAGGLDFHPPKLLPIGHDLARLFVHYGALCARIGTGPGPLPGVDLDGFFQGYRLTGPEDATVLFLTRMRILIDWAQIPKRNRDRNLRHRERFRGLIRLADRAFA